jgi:alanyl-tRNA synthetase
MLRTTELHREDPYRTEFTATVMAVEGGLVELDETAFYARSGGQAGDTGLLAGLPVTDTYYSPERDRVLHVVDWQDEGALKAGDKVAGTVDWDRRYRMMRLHTAQHLSWVVYETVYGSGHEDRGGEIRPDKARLDVSWTDPAAKPVADDLSAALADLVRRDLPIARYPDNSTDQDAGRDSWVWEIEGHPPIPCGGTHVRRTSEVGDVKLGVQRKGSGVFRLSVQLV